MKDSKISGEKNHTKIHRSTKKYIIQNYKDIEYRMFVTKHYT